MPTFQEAQNLPFLIDRLAEVARTGGLRLDLAIMDDDSRDGSLELVQARPESWVRLVVRNADHGLSQAALDGLRRAPGDVLVCMDADLSHPPEAIPEDARQARRGRGLRDRVTLHGGRQHGARLGLPALDQQPRGARWLARPLTHVSDPMSGFFALRRQTFEAGSEFNPVGYKIGLELIVKCRCERVVEVPIHFADRRFGESKLTLRQQLLYLAHLWRLYAFKFGVWTPLVQFLVVGVLGTLVNLLLLTLLASPSTCRSAPALRSRSSARWATNFVVRRRFSGPPADRGSSAAAVRALRAASLPRRPRQPPGAGTALARSPEWPPQAAALAGIAVGTAFNFTASRYLAFKARHFRARR